MPPPIEGASTHQPRPLVPNRSRSMRIPPLPTAANQPRPTQYTRRVPPRSPTIRPPPPPPPPPPRSATIPPPPPPPLQPAETQSEPPGPSPPALNEAEIPSRPSQSSGNASTSSTAASVPRSIRCQDLETTDTPSKRKRGVVVGAKTQYMVRVGGGKIKVEYSDYHKGPANLEIRSLISRDIGSCVRDKISMEAATYRELDKRHKRIVYNYLSVHYDILLEGGEGMWAFISTTAAERYKQWKSDCRRNWLQWKEEVPAEFIHRPEQWDWLCNHFADPKHAELCQKMKLIRNAPRRMDHHSGTTSFSYRAKKHEDNGEVAPIIKTYEDAYAKDEAGRRLVDAMNAKVLELMEERPEDQSTLTFPVETQLSVLETVMGQKRGTMISGVGRCMWRSPKKRGGARISAADSVLEEQVKKAQEDAKQAREESQAHSERIRKLEETIASLLAHHQHGTGSNHSIEQEVSQERDPLDDFHGCLFAPPDANGEADAADEDDDDVEPVDEGDELGS